MKNWLLILLLLNTFGIDAQNLNSTASVLNASNIGALQLTSAYIPGSDLNDLIDLDLQEEISVKNVSKQIKWCVYARLSSVSSGHASIQVQLDPFASPNNTIDPNRTQYTLNLTASDQPFISGKGSLNYATVSYFLFEGTVPEIQMESYQIIYTVQTSACPQP
jgi:hypothetical protein